MRRAQSFAQCSHCVGTCAAIASELLAWSATVGHRFCVNIECVHVNMRTVHGVHVYSVYSATYGICGLHMHSVTLECVQGGCQVT